jgi:hypothetical protein
MRCGFPGLRYLRYRVMMSGLRSLLFVVFPMLLVPGLLAAQAASDAAQAPEETLPPHDQPITESARANWLAQSVVGPDSLAAGVVSAGWGTAFNNPREYGPHFSGFAQRYGMRLPEVVMATQSRQDWEPYGTKIHITIGLARDRGGNVFAMRPR